VNDILLAYLFWVLTIAGLYSYFLYPIVLSLIPSRRASTFAVSGRSTPSLSVIITAHNEQARIRAKLENILSLSPYPGELQIIVASDASSDDTDEIAKEYEARGVQLVRNPNHEGKEAAQALAIQAARGEILVFSDVSTSMEGDVLERVADHFRDPRVGAISSTDRFLDQDGNPSGEGAYVRYEMALRRLESKRNSLIGLSGSFFAARSEVCKSKWATTVPSDYLTAVNCVRLGYVAVSANDVFGLYSDLKNPSKEYARKVRTVVRGMRAVAETRQTLSFRRYGVFAFQVWSHKIMRWLAPWFLLGALLANAFILNLHAIYRLSLIAQVVFYALALLGAISTSARGVSIVRIAYYFVATNVAVMQAGIAFLRGETMTSWTPSER